VRRLSVCLILTCLLAATVFAAAPPGPPVKKLIDDLGDEDDRVWQDAQKRLEGVGEDVCPALRRASKSHVDPDVRLRAEILAEKIRQKLHDEQVLRVRAAALAKKIQQKVLLLDQKLRK
jgi:hypothetical protein